MNRSYVTLLLGLLLLGCSSSSQNSDKNSDAGTPGSGGAGGAGATANGGNSAAGSTPIFTRDDCGTISIANLPKPATTQAAPTMFALGQLVGGRVDPDSTSNQEHHYSIQLAPGFYHLVVDGRTADGDSTNLGIRVTQRLGSGAEEKLVSGNEVARQYRDEAFFEIKTSAVVSLRVDSVFKMADYLMGVFANGAPVPSPLFSHCPPVTALTLGSPASFVLGALGSASEDQWFLVDLDVGDYKFLLDATQADGMDTNLIYYVEVLDRFGQESRAKQVVFENEIGTHFTAQGTFAVGEAAAYWVRLRNGGKDLNVTMTVSAQ